jgi:hypothetical protein
MLPENSRPVDPDAEAERLARQRTEVRLPRLEITGTRPGTAALKVDGHLLPCTSARLVIDATQVPELTVHLPAAGALEVMLDARVKVGRETRAALIALGWREP